MSNDLRNEAIKEAIKLAWCILCAIAIVLCACSCTTIPQDAPQVGMAVVQPEPPIEDITILPTSEAPVNPSKPVTMTSVTVPEPDPAPFEWGSRQKWVRNPERVYPRLIQSRNESDDAWIARMEERSKPRPSR